MMNIDNDEKELKFSSNKRYIWAYLEDSIWQWNPQEQIRFKKINIFDSSFKVENYYVLNSFELV